MQGLSFSLYIFRCKGVHSSPLIPSHGSQTLLSPWVLVEDRAKTSTPPAYEFQRLVHVQQDVGCLKILLRNLFVLQPFFKKP